MYTKITDLSSNTSGMLKGVGVIFRVMKLGRYVIVDDGGNYVTFRLMRAERSYKDIRNFTTPHNDNLKVLPVFQCDRFVQIC